MRPKLQAFGWILLSVPAIAICTYTVYAHHSIAGVFDTNRQITIEATVAEFHYVNPHPFLNVRIDDSGSEWRLEMDNRRELTGAGMTAETFAPGDRVVVAGNLSRTEPQHLYIRRLHRRADGFVYEQVGSRPRISR